MYFTISEYAHYDEHEILSLYESVGWIAYTRAPEVLERAFSNSLITFAARDEKKLIGLIRVVGDGETILFIQDLLVSPEYQRKGVGSALLNEILDRYSHVRQIQLTADADPSLAAFYQSQGMRPLAEIGCAAYSK